MCLFARPVIATSYVNGPQYHQVCISDIAFLFPLQLAATPSCCGWTPVQSFPGLLASPLATRREESGDSCLLQCLCRCPIDHPDHPDHLRGRAAGLAVQRRRSLIILCSCRPPRTGAALLPRSVRRIISVTPSYSGGRGATQQWKGASLPVCQSA